MEWGQPRPAAGRARKQLTASLPWRVAARSRSLVRKYIEGGKKLHSHVAASGGRGVALPTHQAPSVAVSPFVNGSRDEGVRMRGPMSAVVRCRLQFLASTFVPAKEIQTLEATSGSGCHGLTQPGRWSRRSYGRTSARIQWLVAGAGSGCLRTIQNCPDLPRKRGALVIAGHQFDLTRSGDPESQLHRARDLLLLEDGAAAYLGRRAEMAQQGPRSSSATR